MDNQEIKPKFTCANLNSLETELKTLRIEIRERELGLKSDTKTIIKNVPKNIFSRKNTTHSSVQNPAGKLLAKAVNQTILKKEGFLVKFVAGIFAKHVGKRLTQKLLKTKL